MFHMLILICYIFDKYVVSSLLTDDTTQLHRHSICHGTSRNSYMNASCAANQRIFPLIVHVGVKLNNTGCQIYDNPSNSRYEECCQLNNTADCISEYSATNGSVNITYIYHEKCIGRSQCEHYPIAWLPTSRMNCNNSALYLIQSNYMFMDYYCFQVGRIISLPQINEYKYRNDIIYVTASDIRNYAGGIETVDCHCSINAIENNASIQIWLMDIRLKSGTQQIVRIDPVNKTIHQSDQNNYSPTLYFNSTTPRLKLSFKTTKSKDEFIWIGINATSGNVTVTCKSVFQFPVLIPEVPPLSEEKKRTGIIVAGIAGGLALIATGIIFAQKRLKKVNVAEASEDTQGRFRTDAPDFYYGSAYQPSTSAPPVNHGMS